MEEIKVGEYVRTRDGIGKITKIIEKNRECDTYYVADKVMISGFYEHFQKHSSNIIDLIEEGDYVNGIRIVSKEGNTLFISNIEHKILYEPIKNILTKEQFNQVKYEV